MWPQIILTLEQRQLLTRALCWLIIGTGIASIVGSAVLVVVVLGGWLDVAEAITLFLWPLAVLGIGHGGAALVLWFWRSCDRCSYHLYPYQSVGSVARSSVLDTDYPDYRAERFLGSWRWGVII